MILLIKKVIIDDIVDNKSSLIIIVDHIVDNNSWLTVDCIVNNTSLLMILLTITHCWRYCWQVIINDLVDNKSSLKNAPNYMTVITIICLRLFSKMEIASRWIQKWPKITNSFVVCHSQFVMYNIYRTSKIGNNNILIPTFGICAPATLSCVGGKNAGCYGCYWRMQRRPPYTV